ncbi:hypothetical protein NDU88_007596 [Pleurodeles waltl]|uniref:Uncharacterized protein n=1 Tax=Pleurodeles waltl TaxID=8319 RepID=A0AAV7WHJ8_PLEWA|nr:hypothetical protein NDU88_007596 [Pleurodeles waltl]
MERLDRATHFRWGQQVTVTGEAGKGQWRQECWTVLHISGGSNRRLGQERRERTVEMERLDRATHFRWGQQVTVTGEAGKGQWRQECWTVLHISGGSNRRLGQERRERTVEMGRLDSATHLWWE